MRVTKNSINKRSAKIINNEEKEKKRNTIIAKKIFFPHPTNSKRFSAFWFSNYWWLNRFLFYLINASSLTAIAYSISMSEIEILFASIFLILGSWIYIIIRFLTERNWHEKLPFTIEGWSDIVNHNSFGGGNNRTRIWRNCKVELFNTHDTRISDEEQKLRNNIFTNFIHEVHKSFYWTPNILTVDHRLDWKFKDNVAMGSINSIIIIKLKKLIKKDLCLIYTEFKTLKKVKLTIDQKSLYVDEYHTGGD